jgi:hypothetical protein
MMHDPFQESDPRWQPYSPPQEDDEFALPDLTPTTIKSFLRSPEGQREIERIVPPQPKPAPERRGAALGYIQGY